MKYILLIFLILFAFGCPEYKTTQPGKSGEISFNTICLDGHIYYHTSAGFYGGILAPKLHDDGKPVLCK